MPIHIDQKCLSDGVHPVGCFICSRRDGFYRVRNQVAIAAIRLRAEFLNWALAHRQGRLSNPFL